MVLSICSDWRNQKLCLNPHVFFDQLLLGWCFRFFLIVNGEDSDWELRLELQKRQAKKPQILLVAAQVKHLIAVFEDNLITSMPGKHLIEHLSRILRVKFLFRDETLFLGIFATWYLIIDHLFELIHDDTRLFLPFHEYYGFIINQKSRRPLIGMETSQIKEYWFFTRFGEVFCDEFLRN